MPNAAAYRTLTTPGGQPDAATIVKIDPGGYYVSREQAVLIVTVLGSCVAACVRDPLARVGGMNHFMLPTSDDGIWENAAAASLRYGNFAMERLINDVLRGGGHRSRLEIKLFGGAQINGTGASIGLRNADFVEAYLKAERLPITASHLRGDHPRRVHYDPLSGRVRMLEMRRDRTGIATAEARYGSSLSEASADGAIELFA